MYENYAFSSYDEKVEKIFSDNKQPFSHLHTHSDGSHDGLGKVNDLVKFAGEQGFKHLGITEHGTLGSAISFTLACKKNNIKPILGNEVYAEVNGKIYHLTVLASGEVGYDNLVKCNNIGQKGTLRRGAISLHTLLKYNEGLYVLSGCPASPMQRFDYEEAKEVAIKLHNTFGERFFIEIMFSTNGSLPSWERSIQLHEDLNIPLVFTNDVHYPKKEYSDLHLIYQDIKSYGRFGYDSKMLWLVTKQEIGERVKNFVTGNVLFPYLITAMANSFILSEEIEEIEFSSKPKLPKISNANKKLKNMVSIALEEYLLNDNTYSESEVTDRVNVELDVIIGKGYATYFLIVEDIISNARSCGVKIGPGRGSAVGSMVAYLLGITEVNPLHYGLYFERFLNPNRKAMPDIDTDIPASQRAITLDYAMKKYNATPICTQSRFTEKTLIREICRHYRTNRDEENNAADGGVGSQAYHNVIGKFSERQRLYDVLHEQIRHKGKHAGGIVIADDIEIPVERLKDGTLATTWTEGSNSELSQAGIVKFDFLGLSSLDNLIELEKTTGVKADLPHDLHKLENMPCLDLIKQGKTLGVFQLAGSDGMRDYAQKVAPESIHDIIACVSLWRTGPIMAGANEAFLKARHGKPRKIHPEVDAILKDTYGLIVYQEDFMRLYAWATGRDLGDADNARRVIVKFKPEKSESVIALANLESEFINGAITRGLAKEQAVTLWGEIVTHTGYSFNKSHATAYSMITYQMLWYKFFYPAEFYTAFLNNDPDRTQECIFEVISEGYEISMPDINKSSDVYTTDGKTIFVPLTAIKFLGVNGVQEIIENRPYKTAEEFMNKVAKRKVTKRSRMNLYQIGAFDEIGGEFEDYDFGSEDLLKIKKTAPFNKLLKKYFTKPKKVVKILSGESTDVEIKHFIDNVDDEILSDSFKMFAFDILCDHVIDNTQQEIESISNTFDNTFILDVLQRSLSYSSDERQVGLLNIILPSSERVKLINEAISKGQTAGVILDIDDRESAYGKYKTYKIFPGRTVWSRENTGLKVNDWIIGGFTTKTAKLKGWKKI